MNPNSPISKNHSLTPRGQKVAQEYYGINLAQVAQMSDEEVAYYADRAKAMKRLRKLLPILERHFQELIEGKIEYEQFISAIQKQSIKGAEKVDKLTLDAWLVSQGYEKHLGLLQQKAQQEKQLLDTEFNLESQQGWLDFNTALKIIQHKHQQKRQEIGQKYPSAIAAMKTAQQEREQERARMDYWKNGSASATKSKLSNSRSHRHSQQQGGFLTGLWNLITGK